MLSPTEAQQNAKARELREKQRIRRQHTAKLNIVRRKWDKLTPEQRKGKEGKKLKSEYDALVLEYDYEGMLIEPLTPKGKAQYKAIKQQMALDAQKYAMQRIFRANPQVSMQTKMYIILQAMRYKQLVVGNKVSSTRFWGLIAQEFTKQNAFSNISQFAQKNGYSTQTAKHTKSQPEAGKASKLKQNLSQVEEQNQQQISKKQNRLRGTISIRDF